MSFGVIWIQLLLTLVLMDFAVRQLATKVEQWLFYATIIAFVIGFSLKAMHWPYGDRVILMATLVQPALFTLSFRDRAKRKMLNYIILIWLLAGFLENLFGSRHIHDKGMMMLVKNFFFLIYTTWYFYLLVMESKNRRLR